MEMEDHQYGLADLRQLMSGGARSHFPPSIPPHHDLFGSTGYRNSLPHPHHHPPPPPQQQHHHHNPYDLMMMMPRELSDFRSDSAAAAVVADVSAPSSGCGFEMETGCLGGGDGGTGRWPRQETLTLLEIRSRLDTKFKEANQKGPLWDEVSRIMAEEHNYQRSGKKCREKFENLYKYYKKTKEGKAGRQDGKNYRFFRQLEALYGETSNATSLPDPHFAGESNLRFINPSLAPPTSQETHQSHQKHYSDSLSLSNTSEFETSSSEDNGNDDDDELGSVGVMDNDSTEKRRKKRSGGKSWKGKIKQFIDSQMRKLIDKQEVWLEKLMKTLEQKEKERMVREEEWRRQEVSRIDRERGFWAKERAWIEARDAALMDALQKLTGRELREYNSSPDHALMAAENQNHGENQNEDGSEILNNSTIKGDHHHRHHHHDSDAWPESEIAKLIQLRTTMKSRFRQCGTSSSDQENLWEEIASKMGCLGYERTSLMCKEKWEIIENYQRKIDQSNKKRKENYSKSGSTSSYNIYFQTDSSSLYNTTQGGAYCEMKEQSPNSSNNAATGGGGGGNTVPDSCFRFLMGEGDQSQSNLWENFGLKLNNGGDQT